MVVVGVMGHVGIIGMLLVHVGLVLLEVVAHLVKLLWCHQVGVVRVICMSVVGVVVMSIV